MSFGTAALIDFINHRDKLVSDNAVEAFIAVA